MMMPAAGRWTFSGGSLYLQRLDGCDRCRRRLELNCMERSSKLLLMFKMELFLPAKEKLCKLKGKEKKSGFQTSEC
ncbi:unnamed protein product [Linum trigynum]|uniref:Uncharacterized protein n=1 Tax=Linum trigynum TaxID=586398 RepID=A0AAV2DFQ6_9ROSI